MTKAAKQVPTILPSARTLARDLIALIDVVSDRRNRHKIPDKWLDAYAELMRTVMDRDLWNKIFAVQPGNRTNYILVQLGKTRVNWLKEFYSHINQNN